MAPVNAAEVRCGKRDIHVLADAVPLRGEERPHERHRDRGARFEKRGSARHLHWLAMRDAHGVHLAREAVQDKLRKPVVAIRPRLPKVRNGDNGQLRLDPLEKAVAQAECVEGAWRETSDHKVGLAGERREGFLARLRLEVEHNRTFIAVQVEKQAAALRGAVRPGTAPGSGRCRPQASPL